MTELVETVSLYISRCETFSKVSSLKLTLAWHLLADGLCNLPVLGCFFMKCVYILLPLDKPHKKAIKVHVHMKNQQDSHTV